MTKLLDYIYDFLVKNDFPTLLESLRKLEWSVIAKSIYTWLIVLPIVVFLFWTKKFKTIVAIASVFLFLLLIQKTVAPGGDTLSLHDILIFMSGTVVLIGLNIYMIFVRQ